MNTKTSNHMKLFHFFGKTGISAQVIIQRMKLNDIPTQATKIYIRIKQGRSRESTSAVKIENNSASWNETIMLDCRLPEKRSSKKSFNLRFSFRLEDVSGHGHSRYGVALLDLKSLIIDTNQSINLKLQSCSYKSRFSCVILAREKVDKNINLRSTMPSLPILSHDIPLTNDMLDLSDNESYETKTIIRSSNSLLLQDSNNDIMSSGNIRKNNLTASLSFIETTADENIEENELPFTPYPGEIERLSQQVDEIITELLYSCDQQ